MSDVAPSPIPQSDLPWDVDTTTHPRKIVLFADGTGNAFGGEPSNVWRLYQAVDLTFPDQIGWYIPGVGTQTITPLRILDAVTGFGVPSNVRKLYRFLCWNWRPGDEIHLFGFSRGAFTVRALIGLISSQGLVPRVHPDSGVALDHLEMQRQARAAWRAYRTETTRDGGGVGWTVHVTRAVRDGWLWAWEKILRRSADAGVRRAAKIRPRIRFVGLFDTVEAYGVPFEELRKAIDHSIWPMSFRNRNMSPLVDEVRHALSLDDERTSFHPVRIAHAAQGQRAREKQPRDVQEVWFAGVHSDVGGGYPDDALARVPLAWMIEQILGRSGTPLLRLVPGVVPAITHAASAYGPRHDSRSGTGTFYRYCPRKIVASCEFGGVPVIHESVAARMALGTDRYVPVPLPTHADVLFASRGRVPITQARTNAAGRAVTPARPFAAFPPPNPAWLERAHDAVWWRRVLYFALVMAAVVLALLPLCAEFLAAKVAAVHFPDGPADAFQHAWANGQDGARVVAGNLVGAVSSVVPGWLTPWTDLLATQPFLTTVGVALFAGAALGSGRLRDRIADQAHRAWFGGPGNPPPRTIWSSIAHRLRTARWAAWVYTAVTGRVLPRLVILIVYAALAIGVLRLTYDFDQGRGALCQLDRSLTRVDPSSETKTLGRPFPATSPCWDSGLYVKEGHGYTLLIEMEQPWFDRTIPSGAGGFTDGTWRHWSASPLRRWWSAGWFQPIARIGATGTQEWVLVPTDGEAAQRADQRRRIDGTIETIPAEIDEALEQPTFPTLAPIPAELTTRAAAIHAERNLQRRFVSHFVAATSGPLFLYLNDAVVAVPFFPVFTGFYANNSGTARISIREDRAWTP